VEIVELVKAHEPITGEQIAEMLGVSRPTIRSDLSVLVMLGIINAKPKVGYFLGSSMSPAAESLKKLHSMKVRDVQGVPIIVRETTTVNDAVVTLFLENVGSLIVTNDEGELTGIVSRKDLLKVTLGNTNAANMPVSLVMTRQPNIITIEPSDSVIAAAEKLINHQVDCLPVVQKNEHGKIEVVGRVTKSTMTRVLLEIAQ
jgi:CBS domain-containing protein